MHCGNLGVPLRRFTRSTLLWLAAPLVLGLGLLAATMPMVVSAAPPSAPPGQTPCSHGNTGNDCRPDPSVNGKDCDIHGNNGIGGVNEDHCLTPTTTTTETTPVTTTTETTPVTTTTETTPVTTTIKTTPVTTTTVTSTTSTTNANPTTTSGVTNSTPAVTSTTSSIPALSSPSPASSLPNQQASKGVAGVKLSKARPAQKAAARKVVRKAKVQVKASSKRPHVKAASIKRVRALPFTL